MSKVFKLAFFVLLFAVVWSCKNDSKDSEAVNEVNLKTLDFKIVSEKTEDKDYAPQVNIFLTANGLEGKAFIVKDYGYSPLITKEDLGRYQMPTNADFAFFSYFAGGGPDYYGIVSEDEVVVYRAYDKEPHPDLPESLDEKLDYEVIKRFVVSDGKLVAKK